MTSPLHPLDEILAETAEEICGEWDDGQHRGAEAVKRHLSTERAAILAWIHENPHYKAMDAYLEAGGDADYVIMGRSDWERNRNAWIAEQVDTAHARGYREGHKSAMQEQRNKLREET